MWLHSPTEKSPTYFFLKMEVTGSSEILACKKICNVTPNKTLISNIQDSRPNCAIVQLYIQSLQMLKTEMLITREKTLYTNSVKILFCSYLTRYVAYN